MNVHSVLGETRRLGKSPLAPAIRETFWTGGNPLYSTRAMKNGLLLAVYLVFVTAANVLLKQAAGAQAGLPFLALLAAGNIAGFAGILAYTGLLQTLPLHIAFPLSRGFSVIGILASSLLLFHEQLKVTEALGAVLVTGGIILVGSVPRREKE